MSGRRVAARSAAGPKGQRIVYVSGTLDHGSVPSLRSALRSALGTREPVATVVVDLWATPAVAPLAGLAVILDAARVARRRGVALRVTHCPEPLCRALTETFVTAVGPVAIRRDGAVDLV